MIWVLHFVLWHAVDGKVEKAVSECPLSYMANKHIIVHIPWEMATKWTVTDLWLFIQPHGIFSGMSWQHIFQIEECMSNCIIFSLMICIIQWKSQNFTTWMLNGKLKVLFNFRIQIIFIYSAHTYWLIWWQNYQLANHTVCIMFTFWRKIFHFVNVYKQPVTNVTRKDNS